MHVDTPGGSVKSGLSMVDVMDYIESDIQTINTGMAASMGSILLGAGTKGKRGSLSFSRTMLHLSLYTSDAADDLLCVDLGGRRIIKKKKTIKL